MPLRSPIRRTRRGDFTLHLSGRERSVLRSLPAELRELMGTDDPGLRRLFPPAYPQDPERQADYEHLVRDDLLAQRIEAAEVMAATIDAERLTRQQLESWLGALNDLRLVLGTRLGVTEDMYEAGFPSGDPRAQSFGLYQYLTWLQEMTVASLEEGRESAGQDPASSS
jgi:hypothetical protein